MNLKNNKILKISVLISILFLVVLTGGYFILNKNITLVAKGKEKNISTFKKNVKELLEEQNIEFDQNDIISEDLNAKIKDGQKIEVIDVEEKVIKESKEVPFEVKIIEDKNLLKGKVEVEREGKSGENELLYKVTYRNGKEVDKTFIKEVVSTEPINKVVKKGIKTETQVAVSRGYNVGKKQKVQDNSKHMNVVATAYTGDTKTSTGATPKWGTIAVDPSVIPYGSKVYIPQFDKVFIAQDCGSAIKGNKIDIYMESDSSVSSWGVKSIDIYIL